jgi:diguanylate cyclase (GGDEF)-like protein
VKTPLRPSLRAKITLALLFTGLTSAALVGVIARLTFLQQFNRVSFETSLQAFSGDLAAYVEAYGTLDAALQSEAFREFVDRRRETVPAPNRTIGRGSRVGLPGGGSPVGGAQTDGETGPPGGLRGRGAGPAFMPTFIFMALDSRGEPVSGIGPPSPPAITPELRAQARPIRVRDEVVAYAVPIEQPNITLVDETYLDAMQSAVIWGIVGAGFMAVALGFFFSGRLSANLSALAQAIQAMRGGALRQHVTVRSRDEVGFLGESFNRMSEELAESHDMIRQQAGRLRELSIRDQITQLHNRRYFDEQAAIAYFQAHRYDRPLSVCIADIDHFKQVNDRFSHATGDAVLQQVGRILAAATRESDIIARYGGEEFVMAFPETSLAEAVATCERIRRAIEEHPWAEMHPDLRVTMTFGIDADVSRGRLESMVEAADERLYEGKHAGRNRVVCDAAQQASA